MVHPMLLVDQKYNKLEGLLRHSIQNNCGEMSTSLDTSLFNLLTGHKWVKYIIQVRERPCGTLHS